MKEFNNIELTEQEGIGKIEIDNVELKGLSKYEIKRDTDIVTLTISISVPPKNFKTSANKEER